MPEEEKITLTRGTHTGQNNETAKNIFQSNTKVWGRSLLVKTGKTKRIGLMQEKQQ